MHGNKNTTFNFTECVLHFEFQPPLTLISIDYQPVENRVEFKYPSKFIEKFFKGESRVKNEKNELGACLIHKDTLRFAVCKITHKRYEIISLKHYLSIICLKFLSFSCV